MEMQKRKQVTYAVSSEKIVSNVFSVCNSFYKSHFGLEYLSIKYSKMWNKVLLVSEKSPRTKI